jgi:hypothetical protein
MRSINRLRAAGSLKSMVTCLLSQDVVGRRRFFLRKPSPFIQKVSGDIFRLCDGQEGLPALVVAGFRRCWRGPTNTLNQQDYEKVSR